MPPLGRPSEPPSATCQPESEHSCAEAEKGERVSVRTHQMGKQQAGLEKVSLVTQKHSSLQVQEKQ